MRTPAQRVDVDRVLDRELTLPARQAYDVRMRVAPRGGLVIDTALQKGRLVMVAA